MVVNKRKKISRQRGLRWHGWGRGAAHHKGAGNRGGRGRAGSGKRADQKKPSYQKEGKGYLGRHGFTSKSTLKIVAINIKNLEAQLEAYVAQGLATKTGSEFTIDLGNVGYNKLLGSGKATKKMNITVEYASKGSSEKIENAGGQLTVQNSGDEFEEAKEE